MEHTIALLNDRFRTSLVGGRVMLTAGVSALSSDVKEKVLQTVTTFTAFTTDNDPLGEHDFGNFELDGEQLYWKIDL